MKKHVLLVVAIALLLSPLTAHAAPEDDADFAQLFNEHGAVMLLIDQQTGDILYANEGAASFYGYSVSELTSMNVSQINPLAPQEILEEMRAAAAEERNYFKFRHRLAGGELRDVEVFSYPVTYRGRVCLFSIVHDVTDKTLLEQRERSTWTALIIIAAASIAALVVLLAALARRNLGIKKAKKEIEAINELRKTFFDADDDVVYMKDSALRYVFVNKAFERLYGKKSSDVIGITDYELTSDESARLRRDTDNRVVEKQERLVDEILWKGKVYQTVKFPVKMADGAFGIGAYVRDITEQRQREIRLQKALERNRILVEVVTRSFPDRQQQLDYVLHEAIRLTESKIGYIYLYDEARRELTINSWSKDVMRACAIAEKQTTRSLEKTGVWGEAVRQRRPIILNDYQAPNELKKGYPEGHVPLFRFMSVPVLIDDKIVAVVGLGNKESDYDEMDVNELTLLLSGVWNAVARREAQDRLALECNKYWQTIVSIGDGVMVVDRDGRIEMLNTVAQTLTGWTQAQAAGRPYKEVFRLSHEVEGTEIDDPVQAVFETDQIQEMGNSAVLTSKDGKKYDLEDSAAPVRDDNGTTVGAVLVFRDVTDKKEQRGRIEYLSYHDPLTGLYNRRFFEEEMLRLDKPRNLPMSIIMGDVNGLKLTNDIFGHAYGDALLQRVSDVFKSTCRADDVIARWGGDEFIVLLPKTADAEVQSIIARIKAGFAQVKIRAIKGSISLGSHTKTEETDDMMDALDKAESAMYLSKTVDRETVKSDAIKAIIAELHKAYPEEKGHAERVSALSYKMGKLLRLSENEAHKLKFGGLLHDIGKITLEPRREHDRDERKKHATVGYRLLHSFDDTVELAEAALYHHERWDGNGYPKGIQGPAIPLIARVIAIADFFDKQQYPSDGAEAKSKEQALKVVVENAGRRFDPQMVKLFEKMVKADDVKW